MIKIQYIRHTLENKFIYIKFIKFLILDIIPTKSIYDTIKNVYNLSKNNRLII